MPGKRTYLQCEKERTDDSLSVLGQNCLALHDCAEANERTNTVAPSRGAATTHRVAPGSHFEFQHTRIMIARYKLLEQIGRALVGQKQYTEAEPLFLSGYQGMKERAVQIPAGIRQTRLKERLERPVQVYKAKGLMGGAVEWKKKLNELNPCGSP